MSIKSIKSIKEVKLAIAETAAEEKTANKYFRWNLLFTAIIFVALTLPFWFPLIDQVNMFTLDLMVFLVICTHIPWMFITINAARCVYKLRKHAKIQPNIEQIATVPRYQHIFGVCLYKEPLQLMADTLNSVSAQPRALQTLTVVVGLEQETPDREAKIDELHKMYNSKFRRFYVSTHPSGVAGEIAGKCSNLNYAVRQCVENLKKDKEFDFDVDKVILTTGDCDTVFPMGYFKTLEHDFDSLAKEQRERTVWQSPLSYQIKLDEYWFFVRITGLLRTILMMGALIPWSINSMSIFSLSLNLYIKGGYTHPGYQMEDIIALIRWMLHVNTPCTIRLLPLVTLSGPTSGKTFAEEFREWYRQIRRWTMGAGEVFHYFVVKSSRIPFMTAVSWAFKFVLYYGLLLCVAPIFSTFGPMVAVQMLRLHTGSFVQGYMIPTELHYNLILISLLTLTYFWMFMVILFNYALNPLLPENYRDKTPFWRNVFHWLLTVPTILGYCIVELLAFIELSLRGKEVCTHKASRKHALVKDVDKF